MPLFGSSFDPNKLRPHLKMAIQRIMLVRNRKVNAGKVQRRDIAAMLKEGKDEKARIRAEALIREDRVCDALDILELYCELVAERMRFMVSERGCPPDMREQISTLIWAATRVEIPELSEVRRQLTLKYGDEFGHAALVDKEGCVNAKVVEKLTIQPPSSQAVSQYLKAIAEEAHVDWTPSDPDPVAVAVCGFPALPLAGTMVPAALPAPAPMMMAGPGLMPGAMLPGPMMPMPGMGMPPLPGSLPGPLPGPGPMMMMPPGGMMPGLPMAPAAAPPSLPLAPMPDAGTGHLAPPPAYSPTSAELSPAPGAGAGAGGVASAGGAGGVPGLDELSARFEALKRPH